MAESKTTAPDLAAIEEIADAAYRALPEAVRRLVDPVVIRVTDFPDKAVEQDMALESPFDLLGLYHGISLDQKSVMETPQDLDMIFLYRRPLLDYWAESGESLEHIVRHVLIHEIGHHLGLSDEDMERIEATP